MNRDHKVFTVTIEFDAMVRIPDPAAPGSGEMVNAGIQRTERVVTVVAPHAVFVKAWLIENPYRFPNLDIKAITSLRIDAVIDTY